MSTPDSDSDFGEEYLGIEHEPFVVDTPLTVSGRNVNHVFPLGLSTVLDFGEKDETRNGPAVSLKLGLVSVYAKPKERLLASASRRANPFFHLAESLWMLAGRNDVEFPAYFVPRMKDFSDDGVTFNGAYGYRWVNKFGVNQIEVIIDELKKNPSSRRLVLQMWSTQDDLVYGANGGKDSCCLSGDTILRSPEGNLSLRSLAKKFESGILSEYPVYTVNYNKPDHPLELQYCTKVWKTGKKKVFRLHFGDGTSVDATEDHVFFQEHKTGATNQHSAVPVEIHVTETKLRDLKVGDRISRALFWDHPGEYTFFKASLRGGNSHDRRLREHREYFKFLNPNVGISGFDIHHKDETKDNNIRANLLKVNDSDHQAIHASCENPHNKMTPTAKAIRGALHSSSLASYWNRLAPEERSAVISKKVNRSAAQVKLVEKIKKETKKLFAARYEETKSLRRVVKDGNYIEPHKRPKNKPRNGKIVAIEYLGKKTVYDFTVPKNHNAVLENGVVAHNCNLGVKFSTRVIDGVRVLDMFVFCRSNDMILGGYGANVVHFSFLQQYIAERSNLQVGSFIQHSFDAHVYTEALYGPMYNRVIEEHYQQSNTPEDPYSDGDWIVTPILSNPPAIDADNFLFDLQDLRVPKRKMAKPFRSVFFHNIWGPMSAAYAQYKEGNTEAAINILLDANQSHALSNLQMYDWIGAGLDWLRRSQGAQK